MLNIGNKNRANAVQHGNHMELIAESKSVAGLGANGRVTQDLRGTQAEGHPRRPTNEKLGEEKIIKKVQLGKLKTWAVAHLNQRSTLRNVILATPDEIAGGEFMMGMIFVWQLLCNLEFGEAGNSSTWVHGDCDPVEKQTGGKNREG